MSSDTKAVGAEPKTELDVRPTVSHGEPHDAVTAIDNERQMSIRDSFRFWPKAIAFSFVISLAIIMEGMFAVRNHPPAA
jgi:SP family general alpha glucoside:H+ symporter-like MFS transporter